MTDAEKREAWEHPFSEEEGHQNVQSMAGSLLFAASVCGKLENVIGPCAQTARTGRCLAGEDSAWSRRLTGRLTFFAAPKVTSRVRLASYALPFWVSTREINEFPCQDRPGDQTRSRSRSRGTSRRGK